MTLIRVLVVDDHTILRDGIRSLLERQKDMLVVGEAANGLEALQQVEALAPDIVLMDVAMPIMDGLEATPRIKATRPATKVLILTQHDSREYISSLLKAGASGYVLKRAGGREVLAAIRQVNEQGAFLEPDVLQTLLEDYRETPSDDAGIETHLTAREREVLRLVVEGKNSKEIARLLGISPKTVSVHRTNVMSKLGVQNSAELVRYTLQHGLLRTQR